MFFNPHNLNPVSIQCSLSFGRPNIHLKAPCHTNALPSRQPSSECCTANLNVVCPPRIDEVRPGDHVGTWQQDLNLRRLLTPDSRGCIAPDGWRKLVEDTDMMLNLTDPQYRITTVKERLGILSFQFHTELPPMERTIMAAVTSFVSELSASVCDTCGMTGRLRGGQSRVRTLCNTCTIDHSYLPDNNGDAPAVIPLTRNEFIAAPLSRSMEPVEARKIMRDRIAYLRSLQRLTPAEIATRAGISIEAMTSIESGSRPPNAIEVLGLSWAFGVPYEKVFPGFGV